MHPIRTLFGTILLLDLNICDDLHFAMVVANYAGHNFVRRAMALTTVEEHILVYLHHNNMSVYSRMDSRNCESLLNCQIGIQTTP